MTKNFTGFRETFRTTTGCSEQHAVVKKHFETRISLGNFGIVYSDKPIEISPKESKYHKARKFHIKFSNGEELYTLSRYRKVFK